MRYSLLLILLSMLCSEPSLAIMVKLELPDLTAMSDDIVVGQVTALESRWDNDQNYIFTNVTIKLERTLKGMLDEQQVVVKVLGGEAGGLRLRVPDMPRFTLGERVVTCVSLNDKGEFEVTGNFQGKFTIDNELIRENGMKLNELLQRFTELTAAP